MASEKQQVAYEVTVRGNYYAASGKDRLLKTYGPVTFTLPEKVEIPNGKKRIEKDLGGGKKSAEVVQMFKTVPVTDENVALYIVQRKLLPTWLADNKADCVTFRTCQVIPNGIRRVIVPAEKVVVLKKEIKDMSMQELKAFAKLNNLPVDPNMYGSVQEARQAVKDEMEFKALAGEVPATDGTTQPDPDGAVITDEKIPDDPADSLI